MVSPLSTAADGLKLARAGVGKAASDVVRAAQSASSAYQKTAGIARPNGLGAGAPGAGGANAGAAAPRFTPQVGTVASGGQEGDLVTASVALTRAEVAYKATAAAFKATTETTETLLDTLV